jgi:hypothetical protein
VRVHAPFSGKQVKAWPGPVTTPIEALGPSWTSAAGAPAPSDYDGRAAAAAQWLEPALAAYLILAQNNTFMSYSWWCVVGEGASRDGG